MASSKGGRRTISYEDARACVLEAARPLPPEQVSLAEALGRPLNRPVVARHALPPFANSAMDGLAVRGAELAGASADSPAIVRVRETLAAGQVAANGLGAGEAVRIMTGAMLPEGADSVIPVEEFEVTRAAGADQVRLVRAPTPGQNVRQAGLDLAAGAVAVEAGRALTPFDLALLAALGETRLTVGRRPHVAVISTGDELLPPESALTPGAIRDSNLPMLVALLEECGARVVSAKRAGDDPALVGRQVKAALAAADAVITIGGISAGDFDPVKIAIEDIAEIELWHVSMRPGRPQAFGAPERRLFFALPGNPASVACVFEALVRPAIRKLQGFASIDRLRVAAQAAVDIPSARGRTDFVRVALERLDGAWWAAPTGEQVSGHLTPQSRAHGLLVVPAPAEKLAQGNVAEVIVLRWPEGVTA